MTYDASKKRPRTFIPFAQGSDQPPLRIKFTSQQDASRLLECIQESIRVAKEVGGGPVELFFDGCFAPQPVEDRSLKLDAMTLDGAEELADGTLVKKLVETDGVIASVLVHQSGVSLIVGAGERSMRLALQADGDFELVAGEDTYLLGRVGPDADPAASPNTALAGAVITLSGTVGDLSARLDRALKLLEG